MINLATMHKLCNVTYLGRTAMVHSVCGDVQRLPTSQIIEHNEFMSNLQYVVSETYSILSLC